MNGKDPLSLVKLPNLAAFYTRMSSCVSCIKTIIKGSCLGRCFFLKLMTVHHFPQISTALTIFFFFNPIINPLVTIYIQCECLVQKSTSSGLLQMQQQKKFNVQNVTLFNPTFRNKIDSNHS